MTALPGTFPSLLFFIIAFAFFPSALSFPIFSAITTNLLLRQNAVLCLSAVVFQHKNTNGYQLWAINSFEVDTLCAWHQPPWFLSHNASRSIAAATSPPCRNIGITLTDLRFQSISSLIDCSLKPESWGKKKKKLTSLFSAPFLQWIVLLKGTWSALYWGK